MIYAVIVVPDERCPLLVAGLVTNGVNLSGGGGGDAEICANFVRRLFVITAFSADIYWVYFAFNISNGPFCQFTSIHFLLDFKTFKAVGYWIYQYIYFSIHEQLLIYALFKFHFMLHGQCNTLQQQSGQVSKAKVVVIGKYNKKKEKERQ